MKVPVSSRKIYCIFSRCISSQKMAAPDSAWRFAIELSKNMAASSGSKAFHGEEPTLKSHWWWRISSMDQGKLLITEDEESLRFVLKKALEDEGYWVQTAANGNAARQLLTDTHFDVSL